MINYKSDSRERKDKVLVLSSLLSFSLHIILIFYILISYKGENKKKQIVWVSFHTSYKSGQKDMNMGLGGSISESSEDISAYQNNPSPLKSNSDFSSLKSNQSEETGREEKKKNEVKKEDKVIKEDKNQQDKKEKVIKNKESIKAKESKYSKSNTKESSREKKEVAKVAKDIRSQNKQNVRKDKKNSRKEVISQSAYKSDSKNTKNDGNNVKDKEEKNLKDRKEKYGTEKYAAKDLDELEKAIRELARSYSTSGGSGKVGEGSGGGNMEGRTGNGESAQTFISLYAQLIRESIKKNFVIPPSFRGEFLSCVVYLKIGQDGSILDMDLEESSGNRNFDIFVMKAIRSSSPFPQPPSELEIYVRFSNRD